LKNLFHRKPKAPKWAAHWTLVFKDSSGRSYYQCDDELQIPIQRLNAADIVLKELDNRVSNEDLSEFLANHNKLIYSDQKPEEKLRLLAEHTRILSERMEITSPPDLLMKLPALFYVREDEDPYIVDEKIWKEKVDTFLSDMEGGLADFFLKNGLRAYLPLSDTSTQNIEKLLAEIQKVTDVSRKKEAELKAVLS
jgi:hypothetical protein